MDRLDSNLWYYLLSSYKSCIIEYLHEQQYLIGLAMIIKYNALYKMYVLQCPNEWCTYILHPHECGYAHTI